MIISVPVRPVESDTWKFDAAGYVKHSDDYRIYYSKETYEIVTVK